MCLGRPKTYIYVHALKAKGTEGAGREHSFLWHFIEKANRGRGKATSFLLAGEKHISRFSALALRKGAFLSVQYREDDAMQIIIFIHI